MIEGKPLSTGNCFIVYLQAPQAVYDIVQELQQQILLKGGLIFPLPPGIPLWTTIEEPRPPVPGHLPPCSHPMQAGTKLSISNNGQWHIWPFFCGNWLIQLNTALLANRTKEMYSLCIEQGIPLAWTQHWDAEGKQESFNAPKEIFNSIDRPRWKTLNIVCLKLETTVVRPWFMAVHHCEVWRRRLQHAPIE